MKSAVTIAQVPEAEGGPFVFHDPLPDSFAQAAAHGFDAVELFLPGPHFVDIETVNSLATEHGLAIAAVGTGAGMVQQGLSLTDPDPDRRRQALDFVLSMIDFGGQLGAPAILGSMQGKYAKPVSRQEALNWLAAALHAAGERAARHEVPFLYEPLNRYETNILNHAATATDYLHAEGIENVLLLADLFHMAIEERDIADALREMGDKLGHLHFADSNRHAVGFGHTEMRPIVAALRDLGYDAYLSAEIFPHPDAKAAASQTIKAFKDLIP